MQLSYRGQPYDFDPQTGETLRAKTDAQNGATAAKLSYRGQTYSMTPPSVGGVDSEVTGYYRGIPYQIRPSAAQVVVQVPVILQYRGLPYLKV